MSTVRFPTIRGFEIDARLFTAPMRLVPDGRDNRPRSSFAARMSGPWLQSPRLFLELAPIPRVNCPNDLNWALPGFFMSRCAAKFLEALPVELTLKRSFSRPIETAFPCDTVRRIAQHKTLIRAGRARFES